MRAFCLPEDASTGAPANGRRERVRPLRAPGRALVADSARNSPRLQPRGRQNPSGHTWNAWAPAGRPLSGGGPKNRSPVGSTTAAAGPHATRWARDGRNPRSAPQHSAPRRSGAGVWAEPAFVRRKLAWIRRSCDCDDAAPAAVLSRRNANNPSSFHDIATIPRSHLRAPRQGRAGIREPAIRPSVYRNAQLQWRGLGGPIG